MDTILDFDADEDSLILNISDADVLKFINSMDDLWINVNDDNGVMLNDISVENQTELTELVNINALVINVS